MNRIRTTCCEAERVWCDYPDRLGVIRCNCCLDPSPKVADFPKDHYLVGDTIQHRVSGDRLTVTVRLSTGVPNDPSVHVLAIERRTGAGFYVRQRDPRWVLVEG